MITVKTENGNLVVYKDKDQIGKIDKLEIRLSVESEKKDPGVLFLTFTDGTSATYFQSQVTFDIHTNGGYHLVGHGHQAQIRHSFIDFDKNTPIECVLGRIQAFRLKALLESVPTVHIEIDITDSYHDKTKLGFEPPSGGQKC